MHGEADFHLFFEAMTDLLFVSSMEGRILFTNAAVTRTLGYAPDALRAMTVFDVHPADRRREAAEIIAAMTRHERHSCPLPLLRKDGTLVPVETRIWMGRWNGRSCFFGISRNLSAELEAQQRFERLFRSNPAAMAVSSLPDRLFTDVNDAFVRGIRPAPRACGLNRPSLSSALPPLLPGSGMRGLASARGGAAAGPG